MSMNQPAGGHGRAAQGEDVRKLKQRFDWLESFSDVELGEMVFLRDGESLRSGDEYFDISNPERGVFRGEDGQKVDEGSRYVPKSQVPDVVWHKLVRSFK